MSGITERLTKRDEKTGLPHYPRCFEKPCNGFGCENYECNMHLQICEKLAAYEDAEEQGKMQLMNCGECIHKGNREFCLNCFRGGSRDYFMEEVEHE